ncbi:hypothetical protein [Kitasatospora sp. NPDC001527]|uniref:hypothetical protein n=1 Tax=Kitasatospora sp. NPDC001527 TaxID=3154519 RepID=UPI00333417E6
MSTSTGGNTGIQLPSMDWEMEEEGGPAEAPAAEAAEGAGAAAGVVAAESPTEQVAVPHYGPATPETGAGPELPPDAGYGPAEEPGLLEPIGADDPDAPAEPDSRRRRFKRPALVAAATAGVVLMGLPFLITDGADKDHKRGDNLGVNQPDNHLPDGPQIEDAPVPTVPTEPPATGTPAETTAPLVNAETPAQPTVPVDTSGTVPGLQPGGAGTAGVPANTGSQPGGQPAPQAKTSVGGGSSAQGGKTTQPATGGGQPASNQQPASGQQPAPQQPAPQQPAPQQPAPQQPAPQQPAPQQPAPQQPAPPPAAAKATYSAIGGNGCGTSSVAYAQHGWWEQGSTGWLTNSAGGYTGSGCNGKYVSMPMSGAANTDDKDNWVVWTFSTAPVTTGTCKIAVYVPNNSDLKAVGGAPAYYTVQNTSTPNSGTIGDFSVNQTSSRGSWVTAGGTYAVTGGKIAVMLHSRGLDWAGTSTEKAHIAASAVRADCTAS